MGFFKDFKEDLNETASDFSKNSSSDEEMVNTLRQSGKVDPELAKLSAQIEMGKAVGVEEPKSEDEKDGTAETAVITKGLMLKNTIQKILIMPHITALFLLSNVYNIAHLSF